MNRRRSVLPALFIVPGFLLLGGIGAVAFFTLQGAKLPFEIPLFSKPKKDDKAGKIPVPLSARAIPAYEKVSRIHLLDSKGEPAVMFMRAEDIPANWLISPQDILGRVLRKEKQPGYVFTEDDFMPDGTRPGLVAGIPPGKRAIRVSTDEVKGLHGLQPGDRFDLVATIPIDAQASELSKMKFGGSWGPMIALQAKLENALKQATVEIVVQNGVVVSELLNREEATQSASLHGHATKKVPVQEMMIAVDPEEVGRLTEALSLDADVQCIPRSGHPDDPEDSLTPELRARALFPGLLGGDDLSSPITVIETIQGTKRELMTVPRRTEGRDSPNGDGLDENDR